LFNLGVEHEYLNEFKEAIQAFERADQLNKNELEEDPHMANLIQTSLMQVKNKQSSKLQALSNELQTADWVENYIGRSRSVVKDARRGLADA